MIKIKFDTPKVVVRRTTRLDGLPSYVRSCVCRRLSGTYVNVVLARWT